MKIRIKGNYVRFRLTKTEVEAFCENGYFEETTQFREKKLIYAIKAKDGLNGLDVEFINDAIILLVPSKERNTWATSDLVGYENTVSLGKGKDIKLLLEKDFVCLDEVEEDQSDNYPNPRVK
ncbi:hypothetical protein GGR42_003308 [Saonia flava]|uniref:Uncharacterized protein n=1 Tax=Saonia flava TaxID=523696 RepID=A0A846R045_9FLAO|nr:hypothetical protein [Saonia flava]NJB72817.1 hypothetical protein [Saonia flava]